MSGILTIEGPVGFGCQPEMLSDLRRIGFLITSLGWNEKNALTGSHVTGGGLTDQGREFVREAQRVGMLIDVSHLSDEGFWDLMDITQAPIVATHSNSRKVYDCSRNLTDDMFMEICRTGGVAGFNQYADFVGQQPSLDTACDHILHFLELDPEGEHIALGGDLDGCDVLVDGFKDVSDYPKLADRLLKRGAGEEIVSNIFWNNALRVIGCAGCKK
jgi:membrane dipeptidase